MIEIAITSGCARVVRQTAPRPLVYLDHGPMRHIADDAARSRRILASLRRGGTLALSLMNSMEIGNQGPGASVDRIRELLRGVGTSFCLLDFATESVSYIAEATGVPEEEAALDQRSAESLAVWLKWPATPFTAETFVDWSLDDREEVRALATDTKRRLHDMLLKFQAKHQETQRYPPILKPDMRVSYTKSRLLNELLRQGGPFNENDGIDWQHAAVALVACDFVLLDSGWAELAKRVSPRGRRARVFSGKPRQIAAFLDALERFTPPPEGK